MDGYKFDIRCYLLVACNDPHYKAYFHPGYCRMSLEKYTVDGFGKGQDASSAFVHLTNAAIQKKHALYEQKKENQVSTSFPCIIRPPPIVYVPSCS